MKLRDYLKKLKKIEFHTRSRSHEAISGMYHSAFKGRGMTFSECKPYEDGDDVRYIDWHASARQQGIFVKQCIEERELSVCIILDLSRTMRFGSIGRTKAETAIEAMSVIAFSALQNNDKVSLILYDNSGMKFIPQVRGVSNVVRLIIEALKFEGNLGENRLEHVLDKTMSLMKRRCLIFIISDFIQSDYPRPLQHLSHRHEVIPVVVSDPMEHIMPDLGLIALEDSLGNHRQIVDTGNRHFQAEYQANYEKRLLEQKTTFERAGISCVRISTDEDVLKPMMISFEKRASHV